MHAFFVRAGGEPRGKPFITGKKPGVDYADAAKASAIVFGTILALGGKPPLTSVTSLQSESAL